MQQELPDDLKGREFDWYALDSEGCIGLFATFGQGWIPKCVAEHIGEHVAISDTLDAPHVGSADVWTDYAKLGLFVFDWGESRVAYRKMISPIGNPDSALVSRVAAIKGLPRLPFSFAVTAEVGEWL
jgi:hypothetical protein